MLGRIRGARMDAADLIASIAEVEMPDARALRLTAELEIPGRNVAGIWERAERAIWERGR